MTEARIAVVPADVTAVLSIGLWSSLPLVAGATHVMCRRRQPSVEDLAEERLRPWVLRHLEERDRLVHLEDLAGVHEDDPDRHLTGKTPSRA